MTKTAVQFDLPTLRKHFPALTRGAAHFDGPGGTQTPDVVARAVYDTLTGPLANRGMGNEAERNAEDAVRRCREALADLLGAQADGVIFGRSTTQNIMDLARTLAKDWREGDEVVVTRLDHDANVAAWVIAAASRGARVRYADFDPATGELGPEHLEGLLSSRTRVVAVTAASNLIGTMPDLPAIADLVHAAGAWLFVDGVHYTAHTPVDVDALGADFFACSPYKFLGPHCGAVYARPELLETLAPDKLRPSPDRVPERFELGTLPYELMAGTTAAIDFLAGLVPVPAGSAPSRRDRLVASMRAVEAHEDALRARIEKVLRRLPGARLHSRADRRTPTLLVSFEHHSAREVSAFLARRGVNAPAGAFYADAASQHLGLGTAGALRVGLAPYNDHTDIDRLATALEEFFDH